MTRHEFAVVGGGLAGLATGWHLARMGAEVVVLESKTPGHEGGSSHGRARMTRSTYGSRLYVELVAEAHARDWPELSEAAGEPLIRWTDAVFFGPRGGLFTTFEEATLGAGVAGLESLSADQARERFPQLSVGDRDGVLLDHTAGVISADRTILGLRRALKVAGVPLRESMRVSGLEGVPAGVRVLTSEGTLEAAHVVVATGAFTPLLMPSLTGVITPRRQVVGFTHPGEVRAPTVSWARLDDGLVYGLPPHGGDGAKMAGHRLTGSSEDPRCIAPPTASDRVDLLRTLEPSLQSVPELERLETCLYAVTRSEDPVLARVSDRVTVVAGLSGHGFKLGPLLGRIAAHVAMGTSSGVTAYEQARRRFGVTRI